MGNKFSRRDFLKLSASGALGLALAETGLGRALAAGTNGISHALAVVGTPESIDSIPGTKYYSASTKFNQDGLSFGVQAYRVSQNTVMAAVSDVAYPNQGVLTFDFDPAFALTSPGEVVFIPGYGTLGGTFTPSDLLEQQIFLQYCNQGLHMDTVLDSQGIARQIFPFDRTHKRPIVETDQIWVDPKNVPEALTYAREIPAARNFYSTPDMELVGVQAMIPNVSCGSNVYMMTEGQESLAVQPEVLRHDQDAANEYHVWKHIKGRIDKQRECGVDLECYPFMSWAWENNLMPAYSENPAEITFKYLWRGIESLGAYFADGQNAVSAHITKCSCNKESNPGGIEERWPEQPPVHPWIPPGTEDPPVPFVPGGQGGLLEKIEYAANILSNL